MWYLNYVLNGLLTSEHEVWDRCFFGWTVAENSQRWVKRDHITETRGNLVQLKYCILVGEECEVFEKVLWGQNVGIVSAKEQDLNCI